ncbi:MULTISPECIES: hypothetical protein [Priestia]|uniref:hypothetical protein n=1 Tax=Priestia TaxID=2800373 RepID=UPI0007019862|nr:hypothetical protein [Priestia megaterium]KQU23390.1 hypothetical protein ASG61_22380 [Bacillus sp. Leaf75]PFP15819.1 hypothetical protein COJ92_21625 [Priestia megaterium]USL38010.1 hypothetical protein LIT34_09100 [Priestia megaterium]
MYIWSNNEGAISLLYSRPVFIFFIVVLSALLITILMQNKKQLVTGLHVITIAIISLFISGLILFLEGIIVDDLNLSGDTISTYMFLIIVALCLINSVTYSFKNKKLQ